MEDREKLTKLLLPMVESELAGDCSSLVRGWADYLIANGVTIPVRCKDCKWWIDFICTNKNGANCYVINGNWFCAAGERKDNEQSR